VIRQSVASASVRAISGIAYDTAQPEMADHVVEARVRAINFGSTADPRFGLLARYRDSANFTFVTLHRNGRIVLGQLNGGSQKIFASVAATIAAGTWYTLRLEAVDDRLRVYLNGAMRLDVRDGAVDPSSTRALYGLTTSATAAEFDNLKVTQP
jgi:pectate lyase